MPCPYFYPLGQLVWPSAPRLPLGDAYAGLCQADPATPADPDPAALKDCCNLGYARGRCTRFPATDGPDAVRFSVVQDAEGSIRIYWVREKNHRPFDHGPLEYSRAAEGFTGETVSTALRQQAHAYVASYLRRKSRTRKES
jgi:hypothetical protein